MTAPTHRTIGVRIVGLFAVAALAAGACGSDEASTDGAGAQPAADTTGTEPAADSLPSATDPVSDPATPIQNSDVVVTGDALLPFESPDTDPLGVAPVVTGSSFDGTPVTIGGPGDGPTMLVFLAHWCPHCNDEIPVLNSLRDSGSIPADVDIVGISTAVAADRANYPPSEWIVEKDWTWPVLADSEELEAFLSYGGTGFPFTVLLDDNGNVLGRAAGSRSAADITDWLGTLLS